MSPALFALGIFQIGSLQSYLYFPHSWGERCVPPHPPLCSRWCVTIFIQASVELQSSWSQSPKQLGLQHEPLRLVSKSTLRWTSICVRRARLFHCVPMVYWPYKVYGAMEKVKHWRITKSSFSPL
jgi:hypothetical protein